MQTTSILRLIASLTLPIGLTICAQAQTMFRCSNTQGQLAYSDKPCHQDSKMEQVSTRVNSLDTAGAREQALKEENQQLREQLKSNTSERRQKNLVNHPQQDSSSAKIDAFACEKAKRDYEVAASSIDPNKATLKARRSVMYGTCGMREPDTTVVKITSTRQP